MTGYGRAGRDGFFLSRRLCSLSPDQDLSVQNPTVLFQQVKLIAEKPSLIGVAIQTCLPW